MINAEKVLAHFVPADYSDVSTVKSVETLKESVTAKEKTVVENSADNSVDDLPIYTASEKQIQYWHSFGGNVFLQRFLRKYDLQETTRAYDAFKIGLDTEQHAIIFAVDEENHYIKIQLADNNVDLVDEVHAEKVLQKVNNMRIERLKNAPYWI